ncbi:MAG: DUF397 domain-containing protein [Micromonosporaceae bacterium]
MTSVDLAHASWRKSTRSQGSGSCVEVATNLPGVVAVRDTKNRSGQVLIFTAEEWCAFLADAREGRFNI